MVAAIGVVLVGVGTTAQAGWLFVLAAGVLGLAASGAVVSHRLGGAEISRVLPARARAGQRVKVELRVRNRTTRRLPVMRVEDAFPAFEPVAVASEAVPAGASVAAEVDRIATTRGVYDEGPVSIETASPFGLVRSKRKVAAPSRMIVHPAWTELRSFPLPETPAASVDEALAVTRSGHGEVFAGVREYRPGDQRRWVHWRTTARTGRLVVREYEEPSRSPVVLVVSGAGPGDEWEALVAAAASIGAFALTHGRSVHCAGESRFGGDLEGVTKLQLLDWCAGLDSPGTPAAAVAAAFRRWGRRCSFVLFGPDAESLEDAVRLARTRGAGVTIVSSRASGGARRDHAVPVCVVDPERDLKECLES